MIAPDTAWRVQIRKPGRAAWGETFDFFLTTARAWREAETWEACGFEVQVVRGHSIRVEVAPRPAQRAGFTDPESLGTEDP